MTDPQRLELRAAASLLMGHFRREAAAHLRRAGEAGQLVLEALDAGAETMRLHAQITRLLAAAPPAKGKRA